MTKLTFTKLAAPCATIAFAIAMAGCPNTQTPPTPTSTPKPPKPSASASASTPSANPSATPTGATPTVTPSSNATSLPSGSPIGATPTPTPIGATPTPTPAGATPTPTPTATATTSGAVEYVQVERLARPAINEGLIRDNTLLNLWNSVGPDVDATTAAKPIADHATETLQALGNTTPQIQALFTQLLPDVMRIDTLKTSGYASSFGGSTPLDNLSSPKKIPLGGRMITDDVMDITLFLIVPDQTNTAVPNLRSDGVTYNAAHKAVLTEFPYLPAPN